MYGKMDTQKTCVTMTQLGLCAQSVDTIEYISSSINEHNWKGYYVIFSISLSTLKIKQAGLE